MIFLYAALGLLFVLSCVFSFLVLKVSEARRLSSQPGCYSCGSTALHLSHAGGLVDAALALWDCIPYRCEVCYRRQHRFRNSS
ncbi:MAG TPA: hypothetical protein VMT86_16955 [Bryobacteraceae bacterium]|nr:hypothetical protein [Bryobacteraceae bacterium]